MVRKQIRKFNPILLILAAIAVILGLVLFVQNSQSGTVSYTSKDLKISLNYPKGWYIDNRDYAILLTDYYTNLNRDDKPSANQIELYIREFSGCHPTIEENLKDPACGEGGPNIKPNEILSKEVNQTPDGTFYKYVVQSPDSTKFIYYLLENGGRILKISKKPDQSEFEKEFEEIVNSIRFR